MLKISSQVASNSLVLVRKQLTDGSCAALILMRTPRRRYAQHFAEKCPQPPPEKKSRKLLFTAIGATVLGGAAIVYAKHSSDARHWVENNAPWFNDLVTVVYQENETYWEFTWRSLGRINKAINAFMFGTEGVSPMDIKTRPDQDLEAEAKEGFKPKEYVSTLVRTEDCDPPIYDREGVTKEVLALEEEMAAHTKIAVDNFKKALRYCEDYVQNLHKVVEMPFEHLDTRLFSKMRAAITARDNAVNSAKESATKARCALDNLDNLIIRGKLKAPPEHLTITRRYIQKFRKDILNAEKALQKEGDKAVIGEKYWGKVSAARSAYKEELEALFPGVDLCANTLAVGQELDLLVCYTFKQVAYLQNQLAESQTVREQKLNRAIECGDQQMILEVKAEDKVKQERQKMELEFIKRSLIQEADYKKKYTEALAKQYEALEAVTRTRLDAKEKEVMGRFNRAVSEQLEAERVKFKKELAAMAGKLKAIEQMLKQRAANESDSRRSQSVWAAAESLLSATRRNTPCTKIDNELKALEKAGQGDKLVMNILQAIPKETRENGIATERALRDRFDTLEKTATRTALVGRDGASLPMYFLSWVQSKLMFQKLAEIPRDELDNKPIDFTQLDTFDIMQRARYYMERNNLAAALRYVNLLQGAPRAAAACWTGDARRHLEVRQAAEAVMAHAALSAAQE